MIDDNFHHDDMPRHSQGDSEESTSLHIQTAAILDEDRYSLLTGEVVENLQESDNGHAFLPMEEVGTPDSGSVRASLSHIVDSDNGRASLPNAVEETQALTDELVVSPANEITAYSEDSDDDGGAVSPTKEMVANSQNSDDEGDVSIESHMTAISQISEDGQASPVLPFLYKGNLGKAAENRLKSASDMMSELSCTFEDDNDFSAPQMDFECLMSQDETEITSTQTGSNRLHLDEPTIEDESRPVDDESLADSGEEDLFSGPLIPAVRPSATIAGSCVDDNSVNSSQSGENHNIGRVIIISQSGQNHNMVE